MAVSVLLLITQRNALKGLEAPDYDPSFFPTLQGAVLKNMGRVGGFWLVLLFCCFKSKPSNVIDALQGPVSHAVRSNLEK